MADKYYLGLDSGGTKTEVAVLAADGAFVTNAYAGPIQMHHLETPPESVAAVRDAVEQALTQAKITWDDIAFFGFGMSGIDFDDEIPIQTRTLLEPLGVPASRAKVVNDGVVALWGGSPKKRAVILQLGTAFTAGYRDGFGTETPFDHLNAGVLIEIRRIILASCARVWDGRLPKSILPELVLRHFEYDDPIPLIKVGVRNALDRWHLLTVIDPWREAVERGDAVSKKIARDAAKVYVQDLDFLIRKIGGGRVDVVLGGGLLRNGPEYFRACIADGVRAKHPQVTIHLPHLSPAIGAALMAAHTDGRDYPTLYRRAQQTVPS